MRIHGITRLIVLVMMPSAGLTAACVKDPLSITLQTVHIRSGNRLRELAKIGFDNSVCIGFESAQRDDKPVSLDFYRVSVRELLRKIFPGFALEVTESVVNLRQYVSPRPSWLDYRIRSFRSMRADLEFNGGFHLFTFLRDQVYKPEGYAGDFMPGVPGNQVGPIVERNQTVRALLNILISRSTGGGIWAVQGSYPQSKPLPTTGAFWSVAPYGGSFQFVAQQLGI